MNLHEWITAQVDATDTAARAATPGPWEAVVDHHQRGEVNASVWADSIGYYITEKISSGDRHEADANLIALHAPDRALRRCEADRRILARHRLDPAGASTPRATACQGCGVEWVQDYCDPVTDNINDCPELLDLAHAHGITEQELAALNRPAPAPDPTTMPSVRTTITPAMTTDQVPTALRGERWKRRP